MSWTTPQPPTGDGSDAGAPVEPTAFQAAGTPEPPRQPTPRGRRTALIAAGVAGAVLLGGTAYAVGQSASTGTTSATSSTSSSTSQLDPSGQAQPLPGSGLGLGSPPVGGPGGMAGEEHVAGTVSEGSDTEITVTTTDGTTTTYPVDASTQVLYDGAEVSAADIPAGTDVVLHVLDASGADPVLERVLAGTSATQGPGGMGGGRPPGGGLPPGTAPEQEELSGSDATSGTDTSLDV